MLTALFVILALIAYAQVGWLMANAAVDVWLADDNRSRLSFVLFPISFLRGTVGKTWAPIREFDERGVEKPTSTTSDYKIWMIFLWPAKALWNLVAVVICGTVLRFRLRSAERRKRENVHLYGPPLKSDDVGTLIAKRQVIIDEARRLAEQRRAVDEEIERRKTEMDVLLDIVAGSETHSLRYAASEPEDVTSAAVELSQIDDEQAPITLPSGRDPAKHRV